MIDLHCHILPGVDDGPATMGESIDLARLAARDGITTIVATPHTTVAQPRRDVADRAAEVAAALERDGLALRILTGAEIMLTADVPDRLADGTLPSLNGTRYALVELGFSIMPPNLEHALFAIQLAGFRPVMAHVERYRFAQSDHARLDGWGERGVVLQVTAGSLRGDFGRRAQAAAEHVIRRGLPAILATDAHDAGPRRPELAFTRALVGQLVGPERAAELLDLGPAAIVAGEPFPQPAPIEADRDGPGGRPGPLARLLGRLGLGG